LRGYAKPPEAVKLTLEPVMCLMTRNPVVMDWKDIKSELRKDTFIKNIMAFDKNDITPEVKKFVMTKYLKDTVKFDPAKINKASKAAGPLAMWVKSIVEYSEIFHSIAPLRKELKTLEDQGAEMLREKNRLDALVVKLEDSIEGLKVEYAELIAKVENIKNDMK
jgi:dynein heavy chain 1